MNSRETYFCLQPQTMATGVCCRQGPWQGKSIKGERLHSDVKSCFLLNNQEVEGMFGIKIESQ